MFTRVTEGKVGRNQRNLSQSYNCNRAADAGSYTNDMCSACALIQSLKSFKKRIFPRTESCNEDGERDLASVRNDFLSRTELVQKVRDQKATLDQKTSELLFYQAKNLRLRIRVRGLREKLCEFARRGSMKSFSQNLQRAADIGLLDEKQTLIGVLTTIAKNVPVQKNGRRYQLSFKLFLEVILLWGGPRLANFVA